MRDLPPALPIRVNKAHEMDDGRIVAISTDGEIIVISADLNEFSMPKTPFPAMITHSEVIGNKLIATWLSHEFRQARMACLDVDKLTDGISKAELRLSQTTNEIPQVAGAEWSKSLNAEPLAICRIPEGVAFVLWKRGIYAITEDSVELWRSEHIGWGEKLPRYDEVISVISDEDKLYIWSKGGGWKIISNIDGMEISKGKKEFDWTIKNVFSHGENRIFHLEDNRLLLLKGSELILECSIKGPIGYTRFDTQTSSWRISGWRQEILISDNTQVTKENDEILVFNVKRGDHWLNLDNSGSWSHSIISV